MHIVQRVMEERFQETLQSNGLENSNNFDSKKVASILILESYMTQGRWRAGIRLRAGRMEVRFLTVASRFARLRTV